MPVTVLTKRQGWIEVICGCVKSGKTRELILRVEHALQDGRSVQVFRADPGHRNPSPVIISRSGPMQPACPIESIAEIQLNLEQTTHVIAIDEVQFLDSGIVPFCESLADRGLRVILAGLDKDFRGEPFGAVPELSARALRVDELHALCTQCGRPATLSQRLLNGYPASRSTPVLLRGVAVTYEPRCRRCHQLPD